MAYFYGGLYCYSPKSEIRMTREIWSKPIIEWALRQEGQDGKVKKMKRWCRDFRKSWLTCSRGKGGSPIQYILYLCLCRYICNRYIFIDIYILHIIYYVYSNKRQANKTKNENFIRQTNIKWTNGQIRLEITNKKTSKR